MYIFLSILGVIVAVIIILILAAPLKYHINRSIVIDSPLPEVFQ
ncbi:MAG: polyketide cyclase, partial [Flavobacterium sp.]